MNFKCLRGFVLDRVLEINKLRKKYGLNSKYNNLFWYEYIGFNEEYVVGIENDVYEGASESEKLNIEYLNDDWEEQYIKRVIQKEVERKKDSINQKIAQERLLYESLKTKFKDQ